MLFQTSDLGHIRLLNAIYVFFKPILDNPLLIVHNLLNCHLLVQIVPLLLEH